ncbi:flavin reductase family protein [Sphingobium sp.]|uniref:flavin reductase family protein n=1 Tax=Sphingobium sp. TaxID=1912891 RepID=UPI0028BDDAF5|nr:flavin reductase family protein [Sphingobium sp.]
MRRVPGAVAIIATQADGARSGLVATAWTSLCADPPMLLVCVNRSASAHPLILRAGAFSLNLLDETETETVAIFSAQRGLDGDARFLPGCWSPSAQGQPLLRSAVAAFECRLHETHDYGTHTILIGHVEDMRSREDAHPMLYLDGRFARAAMPTESMPN